jgi:hypothetical protein
MLAVIGKMKTDDHEKVYFEFYNDVLEEDYVESLWATVIDREKGYYKLDNIPFFVTGYSSDDIVYAEIEDDRLVVKELIEESGNSTLQIICFQQERVQSIRNELKSMGCESEGSHLPGYFSVEIPAETDYKKIKEYLINLEEQEILSYREACLAH